ncbi:MAG: acetoacetate--CoA ligase [Pseudomonadota bacterium]|nr:acetoacetate--CoA ligase [Rubrivivax sp.]MCA3259088.1 acetoacetate--CoA ligase [Rubrivivax sp.]MCZ8031227.1 acetoacetate--CoA ligase [Rubrivivax sp.]
MRPTPRLLHYQRWLQAQRGLSFPDYDTLWRWSVDDLPAFWQSIWDHFDIQSPTPHECVLDREVMPGARWFEGAQVNFAHQVFRHADAAHAAGHPAIVFADEELLARGGLREVSWPGLRAQVAALARALQRLGVEPGDRVVAVLPNTPQTVAVFLAVASLGAIWSICSPDMGPVAVLDRFRQIEPKVLLACDGYTWAGRHHDRRAHVDALLAQLPTVRHAIRGERIDALLAGADDPLPGAPLEPRWLPFDHPLWIVYSSGTTGLPKPIVHGQGGILVEFLKGTLHNDLGPTVETADRFHWFSSTGWIMWNAQLAGLLAGTTICVFDGNPGGPAAAPDWTTLWRFAGLARCTFFGAGAAFFASCLKADVHPAQAADLSALRAVGSTGSPLSEECHDWIWQRCPPVDGGPVWIDAISGGTDFAGAFVGGNVLLPQRRGVMQCRWLGAAVEAWSEDGRPLVDEVGELVCTRPMPSMPLRFWNDPGDARYRESYFEMFPGVWRHGDWIRITPEGGAVIYGRSDATINRHGVRMGTAELYRAVEALPEVVDSLVVDLEMLGRESWMPLFVVLREGLVLDAALDARIRRAIREALSPRHVPSDIHQVAAVPRTLSGKKMELPVKKLLLGAAPEKVLNRDAMANADCVDWYVAFAARRAAGPAA